AQCLVEGLGHPPPLQQDPIFEEAGEELSATTCHSLDQPLLSLAVTRGPSCRLKCRLERHDTDVARGGVQLYCGAGTYYHGTRGNAGRLQLAPKGGERHPKTVATCFDVALRPVDLDQLAAGMSPPTVERQVGEERPGLVRPEARDDPVAMCQSQATQEF